MRDHRRPEPDWEVRMEAKVNNVLVSGVRDRGVKND